MSLVTVMTWQPIASAWKCSAIRAGSPRSIPPSGYLQQFDGRCHQRHRIAPGVRDTAGEYRNVAGDRRAPAHRHYVTHLRQVIIAVTLTLTRLRQLASRDR